MLVAYSLEEIMPKITHPAILTIGTFDGVHLGHQYILKHLLEIAKNQQLQSVVITFSNHPSDILRPNQATLSICTLVHKIRLIEELGVDRVILLPFTAAFATQTPEEFLTKIKQYIPIHTLILGNDAHIGKDREGNRTTITALSKKLNFSVDYLPDSVIGSGRISSSRIRNHLKSGHFHEVATLLGRPYSLYSTVLKGHGRGAPLGFPTANLSLEGICLPPHGVYTVTLIHNRVRYKGIANLGFAPTLHQTRGLLLEVHLLDVSIDLYDQLVDIEFHKFLRPERQFESVEALKSQIAIDIQNVH